MHQAIWKLTALAVVVGVGVLVVVQAQRGFNSLDQDAANDSTAPTDGGGAQDDEGTDPGDLTTKMSIPDDAFDPFDEDQVVPAAAKTIPVARRAASAAIKGSRDPFELDDRPSSSLIRQPRDSEPPLPAGKNSRRRFETDNDHEHDLTANDDLSDTGTLADPLVDIIDVPDDGDSITHADRETDIRPDTSRAAVRARPALRLNVDDDEMPSEMREGVSDESDDEDTSGLRLRGPEMSHAPRLKPVLNEEPSSLTDDSDFMTDESPTDEPASAPRKLAGSLPAETSESDDDAKMDLSLPRESAAPRVSSSRPPVATLFDDDETSAAEDRTDETTDAARPAAPTSRPQPMTSPDDDESIGIKPAPRTALPTRPLETADPVDFEPRRTPASARDTRPSSAPFDRPADQDEADFAQKPTRRPAAAQVAVRPQLAIDKIAPPEAVLGQPMVYHILVRNKGQIAAHSVVVEDTLPKEVKIDGSIPQAQLEGRRLVWKLGTLEPGHEKKISVRVIPQTEGTLGSVATVNFANRGNSGNAADASATTPHLKFGISAPRQAAVGTLIPFKFHVTNVGSIEARGVVLRDVLPSGLQHPDGDDLEYEIGVLPAGQSRDIELALTAAATGKVVNRVIVTADGNLTEEGQAVVEVVGPALAVVRQGPKRLFPGKGGKYTNTVTNPGSTPIEGVRIVEALPPGLEFVEGSDGAQFYADKRSVNWTIDRLGPGESRPLRVTLKAVERGAQISVVRAADAAGASGETAGTTHVTGVPSLVIEMGELPPLIEVGEQFTLPLRIVNNGSDTATQIRATVTLPPGMELVSAKAPIDYKRSNIANKAAGQRQFKSQQELQFEPIGRLDVRTHVQIELTLKARQTGPARIQVEVQCDQIAEPVRHDRVTTVAALEE